MDKDLIDGSILGNIQLVRRALTSKNTNINVKNKDGYTVLYLACRGKKEDIVRLLIESNADVNICHEIDGDTPLMIACSEGYVKITEYLLESSKVSINDFNKNGWNPLIYASHYGHIQVVKLLIEHHADVNAKGHFGYTALYRGCNTGRYEVIELLLRAGNV